MADAQLADARARLANAEKQWAKTQVRAPESGVVSQRQVQAGDVVQPGSPMFTMVNAAQVKLEAAVPAAALQALRVGTPVEFTVTGFEGRRFTGRVERINPVADAATGQVRLSATIPNEGGALVGGLFAQGRVASETRTGTVVPRTAVDVRGLRPTAVLIKHGVVQKVEVELGLQDDQSEQVEIRRGVAPGDTVLLGAAQGITPRTVVRVVNTGDTGHATGDKAVGAERTP
jgi:RND family efflux transporter MFP subunit